MPEAARVLPVRRGASPHTEHSRQQCVIMQCQNQAITVNDFATTTRAANESLPRQCCAGSGELLLIHRHMKEITMHDRIYHNPRCSKSRATLELLKQRGVDIPVIEYQSAPPSKDELREVITLLGVKPLDIIRSGDDLFADLGLSTANGYSDEQWLDVLAANPKLLQRPIVVRNGKAAIGRPIENVMAIL